MRRVAPIAGVTARTAGEAVVVALRRKATGREDPEFAARTAERYAEALGRSKGALMKAGQLLSFVSMGPAVPAEFQRTYQATLARLRADAPPMAPELTRQVVEAELGRPREEAFATFAPEPLAAASIGQVHEATLADGRRVAVKVQYPGVAEAIEDDLRNNELLTTFLGLLVGLSPKKVRIDRRGIAEEIRARITEELDYEHEAANQREFAAWYRGHPFVHIPEVVDERSTRRVLTQEFVGGRAWDDALAQPAGLRDRWGEAIYRFLFGAEHHFLTFHADPHPGNYAFHDDGTISVMDFGCVKRQPAEWLAQTNAILSACLRGDLDATWEANVAAGWYDRDGGVTPDECYRYWRDGYEMYWGEQPFTVTPEYAEALIELRYSPAGPAGNAFRQAAAPGGFATLARLEIGLVSMLAGLRSTNPWGPMAAETVDGAPPATPMGQAEHDFLAGRATVADA